MNCLEKQQLPTQHNMATNTNRKRSFVQAFLEGESNQEKSTIKHIRLQLARAENKVENSYDNMMKSRERMKKSIEKARECEATHEVDLAEVMKLRALLSTQNCMETERRLQTTSVV